MKPLNLILPFLALTSLSSCESCKHYRDLDVNGGKGGNGTLNVRLIHNDNYIDSAGIVYLAYGAAAPADGRYADSAKCTNTGDQYRASFTNLRKGKYYLYGKSFDKKAGKMIGGGNHYLLHEEATTDFVLGINTPL
jgi:hypothetical protein